MLLEDGEARRRRNKLEIVDAKPSNAARRRRSHGCSYPPPPCALAKILPGTTVRLVSSNRKCFAHYKHISYFFNKYSLSLYVYTRRLLGCLLGFWPLGQTILYESGQKPAGAIIYVYLSEFARRCLLGFRLDLGAAQI